MPGRGKACVQKTHNEFLHRICLEQVHNFCSADLYLTQGCSSYFNTDDVSKPTLGEPITGVLKI